MSDIGYTDSYVGAALNPKTAPKLNKALIAYIRAAKIRFDTILVRGTSGLLVGPIVAQKMRKELIVNRKQDGNHSGKPLEGFTKPRQFIIVDDFICTGNTVKVMLGEMAKKYPMAKCVGIFGWRASGSGDFKFTPEGGNEQVIPKFSMWPGDDCDSFTYEPEIPKAVKKEKPAPAPIELTPPTEAEKYFHRANRKPVQAELAIS